MGRKKGVLILILALLVGFFLGFRPSGERRSRMQKLLFEAREMPFRVFV